MNKFMSKIIQEKAIDTTLSLLQEGYLFMKKRFEKYQTDLFETRLFCKKITCIRGKEAAKIFYNPEYFVRKNVAPKRVQKTLTGEKSIQGMDNLAHTHRKAFFVSLLDSDHAKEIARLIANEWKKQASKWKDKEVVLFDEAKIVLCKTAYQWVGLSLSDEDLIKECADDLISMVYSFGAVGKKHWKGLTARKKTERWISKIIEDIRNNKLQIDHNSILYKIVNYKDLNGNLLEENIVAIELINIVRPIVAIATYITFMALALNEYPEYKDQLASKDKENLEMFVQEVRRFYPFTPFVGAKVKKDFIWKDYKFQKGKLVLLDIYGINHDSRIWNNPDQFQPERFKKWKFDPYEFIPHGGSNPSSSHRCPGEFVTVEIMKTTLDFLVNQITFQVPKQNLNYNMQKIPTLPESGFIMNEIKLKITKSRENI